jgi:hypothetical protein
VGAEAARKVARASILYRQQGAQLAGWRAYVWVCGLEWRGWRVKGGGCSSSGDGRLGVSRRAAASCRRRTTHSAAKACRDGDALAMHFSNPATLNAEC